MTIMMHICTVSQEEKGGWCGAQTNSMIKTVGATSSNHDNNLRQWFLNKLYGLVCIYTRAVQKTHKNRWNRIINPVRSKLVRLVRFF